METLGPLGLLPEIVAKTKASVLDRLRAIEKFDMQRERFLLSKRSDLKLPDTLIHTVEREFKRFFSLELLISEPKYSFSPSTPVDSIWHELIIDTMRYEQLCKKSHGRFIHHIPNSAPEIARTAGEILGYTKTCMRQCYGGVTPSVWGIAADCDKLGCRGEPHPWPL